VAWQFLKTRPLTVYEVAERFRRALLREEAKAARRIRSAYVDAERAILAELKRITAAIDAARRAGLDPRASWQIQEGRLEEALATIRRQIDGFSEIAARQTSARQTAAAVQGLEHAAQLARSAGVTSGWRLLSREQITDLMGFLEPGSPLQELFKAIGPRAASHARTVFAQASATGANPRATAKQLARGLRNLSEDRALLIARTETLRSYRTATQRSYKANSDVVTGWRWMAAHSPRTCPMCLAMDSTIHSVDEVMATHPACVVGPTPVCADSVLRATSRRYSGEILDIRIEGGDILTITPNHPILTRKGWLPAGLLKKGDEVIHSSGPKRTMAAINPNDDHAVASIEEVFGALSSSPLMTTRRMPVAAEDFHGDGSDGQVDIVTPDGLLSDGAISSLLEPFLQQEFVAGDPTLLGLPGGRDSSPMFLGVNGPDDCSVCGGSISGILEGAALGHHETVGLGVRSYRHIAFSKSHTHGTSAHSKGVGNRLLRFAARVSRAHIRGNINASRPTLSDFARNELVSLNGSAEHYSLTFEQTAKALGANVLAPAQFLKRFTGKIGVRKVLEVSRRKVSGIHVYNLETGCGWYFAAGVIVHNCRCAMVPVTPYSRDPRLTGEQWFAQQPDDVQMKILGRRKQELYRSGQLELSDLVSETQHPRWGKGRRESSLSELLSRGSLPKAAPRETPEVFLGAATKSMGRISPMSSRLQGRVKEAMAAIDGLHGAGNLEGTSLPIKLTYSGSEGEFSFYPNGVPDHIALGPRTKIGTVAFAHEFGHFIDHFAGGFFLEGMSGLPDGLPAHVRSAVVKFREAAAASRELQAIEAASRNRGIVEIDGVSTAHSLGAIDYFLDPNEVWARAYAQFVAARVKSKTMLRELNSFRERHALGYASQWSEESFGPISEAVEGILRTIGLLR